MDFDFSLFTAQGIIFSASLVHTRHDLVATALSKALAAFDSMGYVYVSLKEGDGEFRDINGRKFYLWNDTDIRSIFNTVNLKPISFNRTPSTMGTGELWLSYTLFFNRNSTTSP
jgi:hypothetical protein